MNFIIVCIDTLRYDHLGCNGNEWIATPNLDASGASDYQHRPEYLVSYQPYYEIALNIDLHG